MRNTTKKLLGLVGLALVVLLTIVAYLIPTEGVYADTFLGRDTITVKVIGQAEYASVVINDPTTEESSTSPEVPVTFTYLNATGVDFVLKYEDEHGNPVEIPVYSFTPDPADLDPDHGYASGTGVLPLNLRDLGLNYGIYTLEAKADSVIGNPPEDSIEIIYVPVILNQTGANEETNDPIVDLDHDEGIKTIEIMPVDKDGNPLLDEPFVVELTPDGDGNYPSGVTSVTLPFTSNGLETGDYTLKVTAYNADDEELYSPHDTYPAEYTQPLAPDVPNTGAFASGLNIAKSDYLITALLVFGIASVAALRITHRKKTNYRKHIK